MRFDGCFRDIEGCDNLKTCRQKSVVQAAGTRNRLTIFGNVLLGLRVCLAVARLCLRLVAIEFSVACLSGQRPYPWRLKRIERLVTIAFPMTYRDRIGS